MNELVTLSEKEFQEIVQTIPNCFFIEVGANDGKQLDPIYEIVIQNNLSGILIEPIAETFARLQENYKNTPSVIFEQCAIAGHDGMVDLHCNIGTDLHHTLSTAQANYHFTNAEIQSVPALTFTSLLQKHAVTQVDLLVIDVEGYDFKLLQTFPFDTIRPHVVRCECMHIWVEGNTEEEMVTFLERYNYQCYRDEERTDIIATQK
jgi:FkbM family methyltransferase